MALTVIDRCCGHKGGNLYIEVLKEVLETSENKILWFILDVTDPEDVGYTVNMIKLLQTFVDYVKVD